jgi:SOS-response transcriptional repressor LexA
LPVHKFCVAGCSPLKMIAYKVFCYVEFRIVSGKGCPSVREIQEATGASSTREVKQALDKLVEMGYIIRTQEKSRNLRLGRSPTENELRRLAGVYPPKKEESKRFIWSLGKN